MNENVFICYSSRDLDKIRIVRNQLEEWTLKPIVVWHPVLDDNEMASVIKKSIDACHFFILCDSTNARSSSWVQMETNYIKSKGGKINVINVEKSDLEIKILSDEIGKSIAESVDGKISKKKANADNKIFVFLSHSHHDYEKVRVVRDFLETEGFRPLMFFLKCLEKEKYFELTKTLIKEEIDSRQRFILCQSENSKESEWVEFEVKHIKESNRPYEVVDLNWPNSKIEKALRTFKERSTVFLSYPRRLSDLVRTTNEELKLLDYRIFFDQDDMPIGVLFDDYIHKQIEKAANEGYVLVFIDDDINKESYQYSEIVCALEATRFTVVNRIIPVWAFQEKTLSSFMRDNPDIYNAIGRYQGIDVSYMDIQEAAKKIAKQLNEINIRLNP